MAVLDGSAVARKPSEQLADGRVRRKDPALQETDYLEWKSGYDLSAKPGAGKTAKQLIGFANRDPSRAAGHLQGHAYLLLGVEAGKLVGIPAQWDSADVETWVSPFVNAELIYEIHYVTAQGTDA